MKEVAACFPVSQGTAAMLYRPIPPHFKHWYSKNLLLHEASTGKFLTFYFAAVTQTACSDCESQIL